MSDINLSLFFRKELSDIRVSVIHGTNSTNGVTVKSWNGLKHEPSLKYLKLRVWGPSILWSHHCVLIFVSRAFPVQEVSFLSLLPLKRARLPDSGGQEMLFFTYQCLTCWCCSVCWNSHYPFTAQTAALWTQTHTQRHTHHSNTHTNTDKYTQTHR